MKLVILDYGSETTTCYDLGDSAIDWQSEDYEDFMVEQGFRLNFIHWMTTKKDINLKYFTL